MYVFLVNDFNTKVRWFSLKPNWWLVNLFLIVVIAEILLMLTLNTNQSYLWECLNVSVEANMWRLFYAATWDIKGWLKVGGDSCARRNKLEIKIPRCSLRGWWGSCARHNSPLRGDVNKFLLYREFHTLCIVIINEYNTCSSSNE